MVGVRVTYLVGQGVGVRNLAVMREIDVLRGSYIIAVGGYGLVVSLVFDFACVNGDCGVYLQWLQTTKG